MNKIAQPPFNASMMGVVKGVIDHYGLGHSPAMAYGGSGHAFLINVHEAICPSGPYCWKYDGFVRLLRNLGLEMEDLGFISAQSSADEKAALEKAVIGRLDKGELCSVLNMDNQIIYGYDDKGLLLAQPWSCEVPVTPARITFGTWEEFGQELHANCYAFGKLEPAPVLKAAVDSLEHAAELFTAPGKYCFPKYAIGPAAYDNWIAAVEGDKGGSHGNWWNATVWAECRAMASEYFRELSEVHKLGDGGRARKLAEDYKNIAAKLAAASNKEMGAKEKAAVLRELKQKETEAIALVGEYRASL